MPTSFPNPLPRSPRDPAPFLVCFPPPASAASRAYTLFDALSFLSTPRARRPVTDASTRLADNECFFGSISKLCHALVVLYCCRDSRRGGVGVGRAKSGSVDVFAKGSGRRRKPAISLRTLHGQSAWRERVVRSPLLENDLEFRAWWLRAAWGGGVHLAVVCGIDSCSAFWCVLGVPCDRQTQHRRRRRRKERTSQEVVELETRSTAISEGWRGKEERDTRRDVTQTRREKRKAADTSCFESATNSFLQNSILRSRQPLKRDGNVRSDNATTRSREPAAKRTGYR